MRWTARVTAASLAALAASTGIASADPGPGRVEVRNELGAVIGAQLAGADAIAQAMARIRAGTLARLDDTKPWSIVVGAGNYGDVKIDEPNIALLPVGGAAVAINGNGAVNDTGNGCIDITRGAVAVDSIACRNRTGNGIQVVLPASEGGVAIRNAVIEKVGANGIEVTGGQGITILNPQITQAGNDGISFNRASGPGPYRVEGGLVRQSVRDGIDLHDDARNVQVAGVTVEANRENGLESDDPGNADLVVDGSRFLRNANGVVFGGSALRQTLQSSEVSGNTGNGVVLNAGTGFAVRGIRFDGTNAGGDFRFSADARAGGLYDGLVFADTPLSLPGEPRGVIVHSSTPAHRAGILPMAAGFVNLNRFVRVRDIGAPATSAVTLRFGFAAGELAPTRVGTVGVYEDDRAGNGNVWQAVAGSVADPAGPVQVTLLDGQIASGSDSRFATYGPLGLINSAPVVRLITPVAGRATAGRIVSVAASVLDDDQLSAQQVQLLVDGRAVPAGTLAGGIARWKTPRLTLGRHVATVVATDGRGVQGRREWRFRVVNSRPKVMRNLARPFPGQTILRSRNVLIRVPLRDDARVRSLRVRVRVDGVLVRARNRGGYAVARVPSLGAGRHRVVVTVFDRDGAGAQASWRFRIRPF